MQCSNSNSNSSGGGLIDRKPSYFGHPAGSVTLSSLSSLSSLNLSNIGGLGSGLSISNIPGAAVSSNIHHATTTPPTTMYYDPIKYSMSNVWRRSGRKERTSRLFKIDIELFNFLWNLFFYPCECYEKVTKETRILSMLFVSKNRFVKVYNISDFYLYL